MCAYWRNPSSQVWFYLSGCVSHIATLSWWQLSDQVHGAVPDTSAAFHIVTHAVRATQQSAWNAFIGFMIHVGLGMRRLPARQQTALLEASFDDAQFAQRCCAAAVRLPLMRPYAGRVPDVNTEIVVLISPRRHPLFVQVKCLLSN
jgi:hypothetical protein